MSEDHIKAGLLLHHGLNLDWFRRRAKLLLKAFKNREEDALERVSPYFSEPKIQLSEMQLVVAREHGFSSWTKLKKYLDIQDELFALNKELTEKGFKTAEAKGVVDSPLFELDENMTEAEQIDSYKRYKRSTTGIRKIHKRIIANVDANPKLQALEKKLNNLSFRTTAMIEAEEQIYQAEKSCSFCDTPYFDCTIIGRIVAKDLHLCLDCAERSVENYKTISFIRRHGLVEE